jgi:LPPG:FO 2-phospho-L-lactate transferase
VLYTLAGREGPHGWGLAGDTFTVMAALDGLGTDTRFRLGDNDLATCLFRTAALRRGDPLSTITAELTAAFGVAARLLPATDDRLRTEVRTAHGTWLAFQDYFVLRRHRDPVSDIRFSGADDASAAPGVVEAIATADLVVIAPSNPPLSIWPILAVGEIGEAVAASDRVIAVSPLFGGKALKGPADRVMAGLGLPPGNAGVLAAYEGLITDLVVDVGDDADVDRLDTDVRLVAADTRIAEPAAAARFARWLLAWAEETQS